MFEIFFLEERILITLLPEILPFCLKPILKEYRFKYGTSYNKEDELPIINLDKFIKEKYNFLPNDLKNLYCFE